MKSPNLPIPNKDIGQQQLQDEVAELQQRLNSLTQQIHQFESVLRAELANELVEVQELTVLYKHQKLAKKKKRLLQKQRGKNYQAPTDLVAKAKPSKVEKSESDEKERKRLYREAMLYVHPDKFNMDEAQSELATDVTTQLIDIYKSGDLKALQNYHAHIFSGKTLVQISVPTNVEFGTSDTLGFLKGEKARLQNEIEKLEDKHTYKVLMEYPDPMTFLDELKAYYSDRISKLKKRTRAT